MKRDSILGLGAGLLVAAVGLFASTAAVASSDVRRGGTVVFGADQEPGTLNSFIVGGDHLWTYNAHLPVMSGTYIVTRQGTYKNDLVSKVTFTRRPFTVTYQIKKNARWSDGRPLTAQDYLFTWQTIMNKSFNILSTIGYEDISRARIINSKTIRFHYKKVYAGWRDLFGEILPRHALRGENLNEIWRNAINNPKTGRPIASGPFLLQSWNRGTNMTFVRNPRYWGNKPLVDRIIFRFVPDTNTQVQQIRGGELDILVPQPQPSFTSLRGVRGLRTQVTPAQSWEKLDFNLRTPSHSQPGKAHPLMARKFFREAIARGLNRSAIVRTVFGRILPGITLPVLNSGIIMSSSRYYRPHWAKYAYSPTRARQLLERNGCRRGGDGIYVCGGQKASIRWTGTTGNQRREFTFEIAQAQLKAVGIELKSDFAPPAVAFGPKEQSGDFDVFDYAWTSPSPDISGWDSIYGCRTATEAQQNDQGYCNRNVDRLLKAANTELDQAKAAALVNRALGLMANDLAILPLYQLPNMVIHRTNVRGVIDSPFAGGPFWTVRQWWKASS
jgi:peptide/nickel transport system substrate-binding protein